MLPEYQNRIPFFSFKNKPYGEEMRDGVPVDKIVTFIHIITHSRAEVEEIADDFIAKKRNDAKNGRYEMSWVEEFAKGLAEFRQGREIPREGTPTITWRGLAESRREQLALTLPTLEDIAAVPDSSLGDLLGIGGREIRDKAIATLKENVGGSLAAENAQLKSQVANLEEMIANLSAKFDKLNKTQKTTKQLEIED